MRNWAWRLRRWLILWVVGDWEVAINIKYGSDGLVIRKGPAIIAGCTFYGEGRWFDDWDWMPRELTKPERWPVPYPREKRDR